MTAGSDYAGFVCCLLPWKHIDVHKSCGHKLVDYLHISFILTFRCIVLYLQVLCFTCLVLILYSPIGSPQ